MVTSQKNPPVSIDYINWRGERSWRTVHPGKIYFGSTEWHPEPQWLMEAIDCEKGALRAFAIKDIQEWRLSAEQTCGLSYDPVATEGTYEEAFEERKTAIINRGDLPHVSVADQLAILDQLKTFPLGCSLVVNQGLSGYWTDYILNRHLWGSISWEVPPQEELSPLEDFIVHRLPIMQQSIERMVRFEKIVQGKLHEGMTLASIPCGLMSELLTVPLRGHTDIQFIGVDRDPHSICLACQRAKELNHADRTTFYVADAWDFVPQEPVDGLLSHGLSFCVSDSQRLESLYRRCYERIRPGGFLLTSFITPASEWNTPVIDQNDLAFQRILLADVLGLGLYNRSTDETVEMIQKAGFKDVSVSYDRARCFPTVLAEK